MEFYKSIRNKDIIVYEGHIYNICTTTQHFISWRCRIRGCGGSLRTSLNKSNILLQKQHFHEKQENEINKLKLREKLREHICETKNDTFEQVIQDLNSNINNDIRYDINIKHTRDYFIKKQKELLVPVAENQNEILDMYKQTYSNEKFLQFDNKDDDNRILIFSTTEHLNITGRSNCWLSDGTFYTAPKKFSQLYIIHCIHFKNTIPTIYILMGNKTKKSYRIVAEWLKDNINGKPKTWIADFEEVAVSVLQKIYTETKFNGCNFHFNQIIIRYLIKNRFIDLYNDCLEYREFIKSLLVLAYLPAADIILSFDKLKSKNDNSYVKVYNFLKKNFILPYKNKYTKEIEYWSVYDRILDGLPLTTNSCEAYHRHINSSIKLKNSDLGTIINMFKKEEYRIQGKLLNIYAGRYVKKTSKKSVELLNIAKNYDEYKVEEYVTQVLKHLKIFIK